MGSFLSSLYPAQRATAVAFAAAVSGMVIAFPTNGEVSRSVVPKVLQLGGFGILLGCQYWVTFVAGVTMMRLLPRHQFGKVQGALFPKYYSTNVVLHLLCSVCHLMQYPFATWDGIPAIQGWSLIAGSLVSMFNFIWMEPKVHSALDDLHAIEKEHNVGDVIGPMKDKEVLNDPKYIVAKRSFLKWHGASMVFNLFTMVVSGVNLYCFASRL